MEAINYANGSNMTLPADTQIVQGISGNAVYLPAGAGTMPIAGNRNELTISLWRQWDGVVEADHYRGVFSTANIKAYFDQATDFLTVELAGAKTVTDIKDDQEQTHWCFLFSKNGFFKIYKNAELKAELTTGNYPVDFSEGFTLGGGRTHATFDEVRMYKSVVTEPEIRGLYRLVTKGTQVQQLENIVTEIAPKYLGVVETVPDTKTVIITKGEKFGFVDANPGDWVLSGKTIGGWKVGVCYKWSGLAWKPLEPAINYAKEYHACLVHLFEIEELKQQTGHFGALFAKILVAQKALIDELLVNQAFIKNLVVRKLRIDTIEGDEHNDFEAWFDELNGLKIRNKGEEIFRVDTNGDVFAKKAFLQDCSFNGDIYSGPLELSSREPTSTTIEIRTTDTMKELYSKYKAFSFYCNVEQGDKKIKKVSLFISGGNIQLWGTKRVWHSFPNPPPGAPDGYWMSVPAIGGYANVSDYVLTLYTADTKKELYYRIITNIIKTDTQVTGLEYKVGDVPLDERIEQYTLFKSVGGAKTLKLKDLPTMPPQEAGVIWVDDNKILHIS